MPKVSISACLSSSHVIVGLAGVMTFLVGNIVLCGWFLDNESLKSISISFVAMNPLTAITFVLSGICLLLRLSSAPVAKLLFRFLSALIFLIGVLKLVSFFGLDFHLDTLFFTQKTLASNLIPNRMAPNTAIGFSLLGASLLLIDFRAWYAQMCALLSLAISFLALVGYIYGVSPLMQISYFIPMALNTAGTFAVCCIGVLSLRPDDGLVGLVTSEESGGFLLRRMLPILILLPPTFGWLAIRGESLGLFDGRYGVTLVVICGVGVATSMIFWNAKSLNLASRELVTLNRDLESFSYSVSHDLRAPLRSIIGFSEIVLESENEKLSSEGKSSFARIIGSAKKMDRLIIGLLDLTRVSRKEIQKKLFSLTPIAKRLVQQLRESDPNRTVEIIIQEDLKALGDEPLLENVLQNLMANAWKFTSKKPLGRIEVGREIKNEESIYFVRDNGAGFDMNSAKRLFGAFQRLHSSVDFEGTGIGLATVAKIVHRHGGTVWAVGKLDEGATFYFTLTSSRSPGSR